MLYQFTLNEELDDLSINRLGSKIDFWSLLQTDCQQKMMISTELLLKSNCAKIIMSWCIKLLILIAIIFPLLTNADNKNLPIPRFASIKSNEVNARVGPSVKTPIEWVFIKKGEPVEIVEEFEQWRQIRDILGEGGWVHSSVLSGKRSVIIISKDIVTLTKYPNEQSKITAKVSNSVRCLLNKCKDNYCQIRCKNYTGWLPKKSLWGVYTNE